MASDINRYARLHCTRGEDIDIAGMPQAAKRKIDRLFTIDISLFCFSNCPLGLCRIEKPVPDSPDLQLRTGHERAEQEHHVSSGSAFTASSTFPRWRKGQTSFVRLFGRPAVPLRWAPALQPVQREVRNHNLCRMRRGRWPNRHSWYSTPIDNETLPWTEKSQSRNQF